MAPLPSPMTSTPPRPRWARPSSASRRRATRSWSSVAATAWPTASSSPPAASWSSPARTRAARRWC
ncbi:MAG: hypothetical protein MZV63_14135 [Marinilabiliales bacterium]|nr:hypothetical protein [Marinilabiliales bacterium]